MLVLWNLHVFATICPRKLHFSIQSLFNDCFWLEFSFFKTQLKADPKDNLDHFILGFRLMCTVVSVPQTFSLPLKCHQRRVKLSFSWFFCEKRYTCMLVGGRWTELKSPTYISASNEKRSFKITFAFKVDTEKNVKRSYTLNKSTLYSFYCWTEGVYMVEFKLNRSTINTKNRIQFQRKQNESDLVFLDKSKALRHFPLSRKPHHISGLSFFPHLL